MRKKAITIITAMFTAVLFSGCIFDHFSNDDVYTGPEEPVNTKGIIRFRTKLAGINAGVKVDGSVTRGALYSETFDEFCVTAVGPDSIYFENLIARLQPDGTWMTDEPKYWPDYPLKFYGYTPASLGKKVNIRDSALFIKEYTPTKDVKDQADLTTAFQEAGKDSYDGEVPLDFMHALSMVEIQAVNGSDTIPGTSEQKYKVEVLGVKLCQIPSTADLKLQIANGNIPEWSEAEGPADYMIKAPSLSDKITLDRQQRSIMFGQNEYLMLPQELIPWSGTGENNGGAYIAVLCRISDQYGQVLFPKNNPEKFAFAAMPISKSWQIGRKHIYTITFFEDGGGAGIVPPDPYNPDDPDDPDIEPEPEKPGNPVVKTEKTEMTITVNMDDWNDQPAIDVPIKF
jgi:hypothetical protein